MTKEKQSKKKNPNDYISQTQIDELLKIDDLIKEGAEKEETSLIAEIKNAILDSGKLKLTAWVTLREKLSEIEELIPHIDLIIKLKEQQQLKD